MKEFLTAAAILAAGVLIGFLWLLFSSAYAHAADPRFCDTIVRDADGRIHRSSAVIAVFRRDHPCPSTGLISGPCKGWAIDHIIPLASCGCDLPFNLQWLPNSIKSCAGRECKDRWERRVYTCPQVSTVKIGSAP